MIAEYVGIEYADLCRRYLNRDFCKEVNKFFPDYVADKISDMDSDERLDVEIMAVEIEAIGAFCEDLMAYRKDASRDEEQ